MSLRPSFSAAKRLAGGCKRRKASGEDAAASHSARHHAESRLPGSSSVIILLQSSSNLHYQRHCRELCYRRADPARPGPHQRHGATQCLHRQRRPLPDRRSAANARSTLAAQKPGFSLPDDNSVRWFQVGANTPALVPEAHAAERHLWPCHRSRRTADRAHAASPYGEKPPRRTQDVGTAGDDRERRGWAFSFSEPDAGTYYVAAGPLDSELAFLAAGEKAKTGFPHVYYPGVPDLTSAQPVQLTAGQQMEADFSLGTVPIYQVAGTVAGTPAGSGRRLPAAHVRRATTSRWPANFNMETGAFKLDEVPAGSYIVRAISQSGTAADARRGAGQCRDQH